MNNFIELTESEYNAICEARNEAAYEIWMETLENYEDYEDAYNEAVSSSTKSAYKKFKSEFKAESNKLKKALKNDNKEEAKAAIKKMRSILDDMEDKVRDEPDDTGWDAVCMVLKAMGTYLITGLAFAVGGTAVIMTANRKEISKMKHGSDIKSSKKITGQIGLAGLIGKAAAITASVKSIINDVSSSKKAILSAIDKYDRELAKLEKKL